MSDLNKRNQLVAAISDLDEELSISLIKALLDAGEDPVLLVQDCQRGMQIVGDRYEKKYYYLAGLMMGGEIFSEAVQLIRPEIIQKIEGDESGTILIGTVAGDIHDLGKNIVTMLARSHRFTVQDIGVDVPAEIFLKNIHEFKPGVIGLSGLITTAFDSMRHTIKVIRDQGIKTPIVIGGGTIDKEICQYTGADYWVTSAEDGVKIFKKLL
jgi:methanogenic corrinoid protein MtbC1